MTDKDRETYTGKNNCGRPKRGHIPKAADPVPFRHPPPKSISTSLPVGQASHLVSINELARQRGVTPRTLYRHIHRLHAAVGGEWLIMRETDGHGNIWTEDMLLKNEKKPYTYKRYWVNLKLLEAQCPTALSPLPELSPAEELRAFTNEVRAEKRRREALQARVRQLELAVEKLMGRPLPRVRGVREVIV